MDTNGLLLPFRTGLPLEEEVERILPGARILVPSAVRAELERLEARGVEHAAAARALAERFPTVLSEGRGDAAVLEAARALGGSVLTADRRLAERLRRHGIDTLVPRDRTRLHRERGEPQLARPEPAPARRRPKG